MPRFFKSIPPHLRPSGACATPDVAEANPVIGTGGPRNVQFGLKMIFWSAGSYTSIGACGRITLGRLLMGLWKNANGPSLRSGLCLRC